MTITIPPLASERALYADLVTPAPEHDHATCEHCLRGFRGACLFNRFRDGLILTTEEAIEVERYLGPESWSVSFHEPEGGPIPYRLTARAETLCSLQDALDARRADGPISLLPEPR